MHEKLCFVQFIHPGKEHKPDSDLVKHWNRKAHRRKFMRQAGEYIADPKDNRCKKGEVTFWGEWEPESKAERIERPINHGPHYIYKPYYVVPECYVGLQNTDPFVFGKQFHYTWCQQRTKRGPTQLRYLSKGSVILFGSCEDKKAFVLDTVFVVDHWVDHTRAGYIEKLRRAISKEFREVSIFPGYQEPATEGESCALRKKPCIPSDSHDTWRLYFGVTHEKPLKGMYSFFPCQPYAEKSRGFPRPRINLPSIITNRLPRGRKCSEQSRLEEMKSHWENVTEQVTDNGLALGVHAEMPERRTRVGNE